MEKNKKKEQKKTKDTLYIRLYGYSTSEIGKMTGMKSPEISILHKYGYLHIELKSRGIIRRV